MSWKKRHYDQRVLCLKWVGFFCLFVCFGEVHMTIGVDS